MCARDSALQFVPIGRPIANTQMHVLDPELHPVPIGTAGDLYIGGIQVGRGYLNRPELTAERFIPDPFRAGGTLYKTGDLARYLPEGDIEFLGRSDFQVKIRGFRVELGDIESALEAYPGVRGAVVVAHERSDGDLELVAYVAHPDGARVRISELRTYLLARLPEYMVPVRTIIVEHFTLSTNGKIDRRALPPIERVRPELDTPYEPPRSPLERLIAERWSLSLDLDRVGRHDRFFELGGTSLQAARFVTGLQVDLDEPLVVISLFGAPTVAEYAAYLERQYPVSVARLVGSVRTGAGDRETAGAPRDATRDRRSGRTAMARQRETRQAARDS